MPAQKIENFSWGGVDSRSNPANYPTDRFMRCINLIPQLSGKLRLRNGFTQPNMSAVANLPIHSAAYYELFNGTQFIIFGQGTALKQYALATGTVTLIATLASGANWSHFRANNKIYIMNGTDMVSYDGTTVRPMGIRAPTAAEVSSTTVAAATSPAGTFGVTSLSGYQFYISYYDPTSGVIGNAIAIGGRVTVAGATDSIAIANLPNLSGVNPEWVKLIGRTNDGGQIPYACIDASGNLIVAGNSSTSASVTSSAFNPNMEMPTRNTPPSGFDKCTSVLGRVFLNRPGDFNIFYTPTAADSPTGQWTGVAEESAPADNLIPFPTAEPVTCLQGYNFSAWFFTRNHMAIWSEYLNGVTGNANPWQGVWPIGCAGQRAFVITPYGPYWLSGNKELMTWSGDGPVPASGEYQLGLLGKIADTNLALTEVTYLRDPENEIDRVYVRGWDANNNPVVVIHDFNLRDVRSIFGQGYQYTYTGLVPQTFVGAGCSPFVPVSDTSLKIRMWAGGADGHFNQLEDGNSDNGQEYAGDCIGMYDMGTELPLITDVQFTGDDKLQFSYGTQLAQQIDDFISPDMREPTSENDDRMIYSVGGEGRYLIYRLQLTSHHADGNFTPTDPLFCPINAYGTIFGARTTLGATRSLAA